jgi:hypothetical protein
MGNIRSLNFQNERWCLACACRDDQVAVRTQVRSADLPCHSAYGRRRDAPRQATVLAARTAPSAGPPRPPVRPVRRSARARSARTAPSARSARARNHHRVQLYPR